ncbi:hypothetical protein NSY55_26345 [Pseudomonas aeruginosa]|nr:hypothetical protein [Pseudomonas aeruginosa]
MGGRQRHAQRFLEQRLQRQSMQVCRGKADPRIQFAFAHALQQSQWQRLAQAQLHLRMGGNEAPGQRRHRAVRCMHHEAHAQLAEFTRGHLLRAAAGLFQPDQHVARILGEARAGGRQPHMA